MVHRGERSHVPIASFAATQKSSGHFTVFDEASYGTHVPVEEPPTASFAALYDRLLRKKRNRRDYLCGNGSLVRKVPNPIFMPASRLSAGATSEQVANQAFEQHEECCRSY